MSDIAVIGGGAWGTGIAIVLGRKGTHRVRLWAHESDVCESIAQKRINERFLPGRQIPDSVTATNDLAAALSGAQIIVSVMPSQHCRALFERMRPLIEPQAMIVSATKGLEEESLQRMTEVIASVLKHGAGTAHALGALSGPSFAQEVARGDPTAITIASQNAELLRTVQQEFSDSSFRVYTNGDVVGVELGGALKNTVAIAAGICDGLGLGHNSVAALITRGLAEMTRLVVACGGRPETMAGLAGLGDPRPHLHRRPLAQPQRRRRTRTRQEAPRNHRRHARHGRGRRIHRLRRRRTRPRPPRGNAHHRANARHPARRQIPQRSNPSINVKNRQKRN